VTLMPIMPVIFLVIATTLVGVVVRDDGSRLCLLWIRV
jgi:hypothetical protein